MHYQLLPSQADGEFVELVGFHPGVFLPEKLVDFKEGPVLLAFKKLLQLSRAAVVHSINSPREGVIVEIP